MSNVEEKLYDFSDEAKRGIALAMHAINEVLNEEAVEGKYSSAPKEGEEEPANGKKASDIKITFDTGKCYTGQQYRLGIPDNFTLERETEDEFVLYLKQAEDETEKYSIAIYPEKEISAELSFDYHIPEIYNVSCEVIYWTVLKRALKPVIGHSGYCPLVMEHAFGGCCYGLSEDIDLAENYYVAFYNGTIYQMFHVVMDGLTGNKEEKINLLEQIFAGFVPEEEIVTFPPLSDDQFAARIITKEDVENWLREIRKRTEEINDLLHIQCTLEEKARIPYERHTGKLSDDAVKARFVSYVRQREDKNDQFLLEMAEYFEKVRSLAQDEDEMFYLYSRTQDFLLEQSGTSILLNDEEIREESKVFNDVMNRIFSGDVKTKFEERLRIEREQKEKAEREKREAERKARLEVEMEKWRTEIEIIKKQRDDKRLETFKKIDIDEKLAHDKVHQEKQPQIQPLNEEKDKIWAEIEEKKIQLAALGMLDMAKKKEITQGIETLEKQLLEVNSKIFDIEAKAEAENQEIRNKALHDRENLEELLAQKFPYPESPEVIEARRLAEEQNQS